jgi:glycosyltransferase involved in cell wall biosynthesis
LFSQGISGGKKGKIDPRDQEILYRKRTVGNDSAVMKLSIIMPVLNEAKTLPVILQKVLNVALEKEIIIVNDGSTDDTHNILEKYRNHAGISLIRHLSTQGKGGAVQSALKQVKGDIVIIQDADLEYDPEDYAKLIAPITAGQYLVVFGTRTGPNHSYFRYFLGGKMLTMLANILYRQHLTDVFTCYKVFSSEILKDIQIEGRGFDFDPEVTAKVVRKGIQIGQVPISYYPRSFEEGKKIRWVDGLIAAWILIKYRFVNL